MPINKVIIWLLFVGSLTACKTSKSDQQQQVKHLTLVQATQKPWTAGIKQTGSGVEYTFLVIAQKNAIKCDSAWVNGQSLYLKVFNENSLIKDYNQITIGDTLRLRCSGKETVEKPVVPPVKMADGQALIKSKAGDQVDYLLVEEIEMVESKPRQ